MLTRLKVSGFKNLVDVDVRFGPFTCIAGANGTGKSNLFDAIQFLSALADIRLIEAAQAVRSEDECYTDIRSLFHRTGDTVAPDMSFEAEMIIPAEGCDEIGQPAEACITLVRYGLTLAYRADETFRTVGSLEILEERLEQINIGDAHRHLLFPHSASQWRRSVVTGRRTSSFISTGEEDGHTIIRLHQDGGSHGRPRPYLAASLPRTVLSTTNAAEHPTSFLTRREMRSWQVYQFEPAALRRPARFTAPGTLGSDGSFLPVALEGIARARSHGQPSEQETERVYAQVSDRLADLTGDVGGLAVEHDEQRQLLTVFVTDRSGTSHPAHALSDGTLRLLALAVLERDPAALGTICLEEPENGIHPGRIPAMLALLQDMAADVFEPVSEDNPLRQVIVTTHSPAVVQHVPEASLLVARLDETGRDEKYGDCASFGGLSGTWRTTDIDQPVGLDDVLDDLNPDRDRPQQHDLPPKRVADRADPQPTLPGFEG